MRPCESGTAATANPPAAATRASSAMKSMGEGFFSRRIREFLHQSDARSTPRRCLLVDRRVRERRLVAAAPAEGVLDLGRVRAQLIDDHLGAAAMVPGDDAGDRLLVDHGLGHPHRHLLADAEPAAPRRVIDLDRGGPHLHEVARLEGPRELLQCGAAGFAGVDGLERRALRLVRGIFEVQHEVPRRAGLIVVVARDDDDPPAAEVGLAGAAVDDLPRQGTEADPVGRPPALPPADPPARADRLAVAGLEICTGERPWPDLMWKAHRTSVAQAATGRSPDVVDRASRTLDSGSCDGR